MAIYTFQNCTDVQALHNSLSLCKGKPFLRGIKRIFFAPKSYFTAIPYKTAAHLKQIMENDAHDSPTTMHLARAAGYAYSQFTFAADKSWHELQVIDTVGNLQTETQGDKWGRTFHTTLSVRTPRTGYYAIVEGIRLTYDDIVFLVEKRNGDVLVLMDETNQANVTVNTATGEGTDGDFGTTVNIELDSILPPLLLFNAIGPDATAGSISADTGSVIILPALKTSTGSGGSSGNVTVDMDTSDGIYAGAPHASFDPENYGDKVEDEEKP